MTDRIRSLTVALDADYRDDDIVALADAIRCFRGVVAVTANVVKANDWTAEQRVRFDLEAKLYEVLKPKDNT